MNILNFLKLREMQDIKDYDSRESVLLRAQIINKKRFLNNLYVDFYSHFRKPAKDLIRSSLLNSIELGSGCGFLKNIIPGIITSDVLMLPDIDICLDAQELPFKNDSVGGFFMVNVFHHIKKPIIFFEELYRTLKSQGKIIMIEPANTVWSGFIYQKFHHEIFDPQAEWTTKEIGSVSSANGALPYIVFIRDRNKYEKLFPFLKIKKIKIHTPFRYIISGGFSKKQLLPSFTYNMIKTIEFMLHPINKYIGMFYTIEIQKIDNGKS